MIPLLIGGSRFAAIWNAKIHSGFSGRSGLTERATAFRTQIGRKPLLLFHCASAGELEALKPLINAFDREKAALALSYFSPSAQSALKGCAAFDFADFSPVDSAECVQGYLNALQPSVIAITKHDVWPNMIWQASARGIPLYMINGNFHSRSLKHWPVIRGFETAVYSEFQEIMTVSEDDATNARRIVGTRVPVVSVGDSRFDRVLERIAQKNPLPEGLGVHARNRRIIIAGSTHEEDEELLLPVAARLMKAIPELLIIAVPHDPLPAAKVRISRLCRRYGLSLYDLDGDSKSNCPHVLLVNRTGILADLYRNGEIAFVGGAFGKGVHSVLEPMASGVPVVCGPNIAVSHEARIAVRDGVLCTVRNRGECERVLRLWLTDNKLLQDLHSKAESFVRIRSGTAERIARRLTAALNG